MTRAISMDDWRALSELTVTIGADGIIADISPALASLVGHSRDELAGMLFLDFLHPDDLDRTVAAWTALGDSESVLRFENRYRRGDGSYVWLSWNGLRHGGTVIADARVIDDEMRQRERLAHREAEAHEREQAIAILFHDLRNPVAALAAAVRILGRESQSPRSRTVLELAEKAVSRMDVLIDDVSDFAQARLGSGLTLERRSDAALTPVIRHAVDEVRLSQTDRPIEERYDFADPVDCDADRVAQLVSNLVGNAANHGRPGSPIRIKGWDERDKLHISVWNDGDPIPSDRRDVLFQPFVRAGAGGDRRSLGLGLFIAKEIASSHGGDLSVRSEPEGTEFTFSLPR